MTRNTGAGTTSTRPAPDTEPDGTDDIYAWGAILLEDGRIISLAWLREYPGAVTATARRWR